MMQNLGIIIYTSPFSHPRSATALDFILAASALDIVLQILFLAAGVTNLTHKSPTAFVPPLLSDYTKGFAALPLYGITQIYAESHAMDHYHLTKNDLLLPVELLTPQSILAFLQQQDKVMYF